MQFVFIVAGVVLEAELGGPAELRAFPLGDYLLWIGLGTVPFLCSHGYSFAVNFIGKGEHCKRSMEQQMSNGMLRVAVGFKGTDTHGLKAFRRAPPLAQMLSMPVVGVPFARAATKSNIGSSPSPRQT